MMINLIGPEQGAINALNDRRYAVRRIETLIGIHLFGKVRVRRNLPAADINRVKSSSYLLHGLVSAQRAERHYRLLRPEQSPEPLGPFPGQRLFDSDRAAQSLYVLLRVRSNDGVPPLSSLAISRRHFNPLFLEGSPRFQNQNPVIRFQNKCRYPGMDCYVLRH
jgi:hypothetical protein